MYLKIMSVVALVYAEVVYVCKQQRRVDALETN